MIGLPPTPKPQQNESSSPDRSADRAPSPALKGDPWHPAEVDRRRSEWRRTEGSNPDPDEPIPDRGPGSDQGGHQARNRTPHEGERNVNRAEEHSRRPKGNPEGRRR